MEQLSIVLGCLLLLFLFGMIAVGIIRRAYGIILHRFTLNRR